MASSRRSLPRLLQEVSAFGVVGAVNTAVDIGLLNLLVYGADVAPVPAKIVSSLVSATSAYTMNRYWTFRHRERQAVRREYVLFLALNAVGLALNVSILAGCRYGLGWTGPLALNASNAAGILLASAFRFAGYRRFVWTAPRTVQDAAHVGDVAAGRAVGAAPSAGPGCATA